MKLTAPADHYKQYYPSFRQKPNKNKTAWAVMPGKERERAHSAFLYITRQLLGETLKIEHSAN